MTIKATILNVCDTFLKPKFLLKYVLTQPKIEGGMVMYTCHLLGIQKQVFILNSN